MNIQFSRSMGTPPALRWRSAPAHTLTSFYRQSCSSPHSHFILQTILLQPTLSLHSTYNPAPAHTRFILRTVLLHPTLSLHSTYDPAPAHNLVLFYRQSYSSSYSHFILRTVQLQPTLSLRSADCGGKRKMLTLGSKISSCRRCCCCS
jgi:hypothetical protein